MCSIWDFDSRIPLSTESSSVLPGEPLQFSTPALLTGSCISYTGSLGGPEVSRTVDKRPDGATQKQTGLCPRRKRPSSPGSWKRKPCIQSLFSNIFHHLKNKKQKQTNPLISRKILEVVAPSMSLCFAGNMLLYFQQVGVRRFKCALVAKNRAHTFQRQGPRANLKRVMREHPALDGWMPPARPAPTTPPRPATAKKDKLAQTGRSPVAWTCAESLTNSISLNPPNNPGGVSQTRYQRSEEAKPHPLRGPVSR